MVLVALSGSAVKSLPVPWSLSRPKGTKSPLKTFSCFGDRTSRYCLFRDNFGSSREWVCVSEYVRVRWPTGSWVGIGIQEHSLNANGTPPSGLASLLPLLLLWYSLNRYDYDWMAKQFRGARERERERAWRSRAGHFVIFWLFGRSSQFTILLLFKFCLLSRDQILPGCRESDSNPGPLD